MFQKVIALAYKHDGYGTNETIESVSRLPWQVFIFLYSEHCKSVERVNKSIQAISAGGKKKGKKVQ